MYSELLVGREESLSIVVHPSQVDDDFLHLVQLNLSGKEVYIYGLLQA